MLLWHQRLRGWDFTVLLERDQTTLFRFRIHTSSRKSVIVCRKMLDCVPVLQASLILFYRQTGGKCERQRSIYCWCRGLLIHCLQSRVILFCTLQDLADAFTSAASGRMSKMLDKKVAYFKLSCSILCTQGKRRIFLFIKTSIYTKACSPKSSEIIS